MNTFPPHPHSFRRPVGVEPTDGIVKLIGRSARKSWNMWLRSISGSGTWLSAQILKSQESSLFIRRQNHIFCSILYKSFHCIHLIAKMSCNSFPPPPPPAGALFGFIEMNVWRCLYDTDILFWVQLSLERVPCVFLPLLTSALPLSKFPLQQHIIHQKIELSVALQRWRN